MIRTLPPERNADLDPEKQVNETHHFCCCDVRLNTLLGRNNRGGHPQDQFYLRNTGDLAALCSASTTDPLYTAAINFCHGFGAGTYGVLAEAQQANPKLQLFCPSEGITRNEAVAAFVSWARADPAHAVMPATDGVTAFLTQTYPCSGATKATPERRRTP